MFLRLVGRPLNVFQYTMKFYENPSLNRIYNIDNRKYSNVPESFYIKNVEKNALIPNRLNQLRDNKGARKKEHRVGRGTGSGRGKTSTYGHKGRTARQGGEVAFGFEGGQSPYYKRLRKFGFTNTYHKRVYAPVNLSRVQFFIDTGRLDTTRKITMKDLVDSGCVGRIRKKQCGIKVLGDGAEWFKANINIEVSQASVSAINAIKQAGGVIRLVHYDRVSLRALLYPEKYYPYTQRKLPYCQSPPIHINKRLLNRMEQPDQFEYYLEAEERREKNLIDFVNEFSVAPNTRKKGEGARKTGLEVEEESFIDTSKLESEGNVELNEVLFNGAQISSEPLDSDQARSETLVNDKLVSETPDIDQLSPEDIDKIRTIFESPEDSSAKSEELVQKSSAKDNLDSITSEKSNVSKVAENEKSLNNVKKDLEKNTSKSTKIKVKSEKKMKSKNKQIKAGDGKLKSIANKIRSSDDEEIKLITKKLKSKTAGISKKASRGLIKKLD